MKTILSLLLLSVATCNPTTKPPKKEVKKDTIQRVDTVQKTYDKKHNSPEL